MSTIYKAACFCGAVRLQISANPKSVIHCHCGQCRRLSGSAFTTWVSFAETAVAVTGTESLTAFQATANAQRHFCSSCGAHVYTADKRYPEMVGVPAGALDGDVAVNPSAHYFVSHRAAWHAINDALPQFGGESGYAPMGVPSATKQSPKP